MTPLHFAAQRGDIECVQMLLDARADPALTNSEGQNAAGAAAGHVDVQRLLYMQLANESKGSGTRFPSAALVAAGARGDHATTRRLLRVKRGGAHPIAAHTNPPFPHTHTLLQRSALAVMSTRPRKPLHSGATVTC